jgi:L-alanine-DL-glutamate epimerase-like enolase superfamily enzyme
MSLQEIQIHRINMPLDRPYPLSFNAVHMGAFDALLAEVRDDDGRIGWGEVTILPGYTHETVESGWEFCCAQGERLVGQTVAAAKRQLIAHIPTSPHAVNPLLCAIEMMEGHPLLQISEPCRVHVLAPVRSLDDAEIPGEVERLLGLGHRTLKVKVGFDVDADLARLRLIARVAGGQARLRTDANQGYSVEQGRRFAAALDPDAIELFEQPCDRLDWQANARVAEVSAVPVMLDEAVYSFADTQQAAGLSGVRYVKHVLEKFGGIEMLRAALDFIRVCGMEPVLGNGGATDITSWMEACVARVCVQMPCEMHGFLKVKDPLLEAPLPFKDGSILLEPGYAPRVNREVVKAHQTATRRFSAKAMVA